MFDDFQSFCELGLVVGLILHFPDAFVEVPEQFVVTEGPEETVWLEECLLSDGGSRVAQLLVLVLGFEIVVVE